jgi:hypothetical protein
MPGKQHEARSVRWDLDPKILARLALVADRMSRKQRLQEIAAALGISMSTINRDAARVREQWRRDSLKDIDEKRAESLAQYEKVLAAAWKAYRKAESTEHSVLPALRLINETQEKIDKLLGTVITRLDMTSNGESLATRDPRQLSDAELAALAGLPPAAS